MGTVFDYRSIASHSHYEVFLLSFSLAPPWLPLRLIMDMAVTAVDTDMAVMDMAVDTADMVVIIVASDLLMPNLKPNPPLLLRLMPKLHHGTDMVVMDMAVDTVLDMVVIIVASDLLMPMPKLPHGTAMEDTDTAVDTDMAVMAVMDMAVDTTGVRPHTPK